MYDYVGARMPEQTSRAGPSPFLWGIELCVLAQRPLFVDPFAPKFRGRGLASAPATGEGLGRLLLAQALCCAEPDGYAKPRKENKIWRTISSFYLSPARQGGTHSAQERA